MLQMYDTLVFLSFFMFAFMGERVTFIEYFSA